MLFKPFTAVVTICGVIVLSIPGFYGNRSVISVCGFHGSHPDRTVKFVSRVLPVHKNKICKCLSFEIMQVEVYKVKKKLV